MSIDLDKERLHNEGAFYKCLSSLSHYNNVSVAMLDSLYNKNFNTIVINSGFNKNNEFCLELVNLLNLKVY